MSNEYPKIKGLIYEMEEYLYELKDINSLKNPTRITFLVSQYKKDLKNLLEIIEKYLKISKNVKNNEKEKEEIRQFKKKYQQIHAQLETNVKYQKLKFELAPSKKANNHPELLHELVCVLLKDKKISKNSYFISDESLVSDFATTQKFLDSLSKFREKYNLKKIKLTDTIWEIVEKMHKFKSF